MEVTFGPNSIDEPNLLYKLQNKIKVFNTSNPLSKRGYNLVASSSKYGLVFIASPNAILSVYQLGPLLDKEITQQYFSVRLQENPTHIAVSCDHELLAVTGGQYLDIYKVTDFQNQNVRPSVSMNCEVAPSAFVSSVQWNPCLPCTIAVVYFDGTLLVSEVTTNKFSKIQCNARCLCWSPKGKQLVTGNSDGTLSQYKPNLTLAKNIPAPNIFNGAPVEALAIYWISTFQFAVVFKNASDNSRPSVTLVNTPKADAMSCINYEDICFSIGSERPWYYFLVGVPQWNIILASSSNSMEIATLGSSDGANWTHWTQADTARPELPLTGKSKQENYPVGMCYDTCALHQLPWGENEVLPHMPTLLVVSQTGMLTIFNMINLNKAAQQICTPLQTLALPANGLTSEIPDDAPSQPQAPAPTTAFVPQPKAQPVPQNPTLAPAPVTSQIRLALQQPSVETLSYSQPQSNNGLNIPNPPVVQQKLKPVQPAAVAAPPNKPNPVPIQIPKPQSPAQTQEANAALKAEQHRINKMKANQELKDMLVREVNEFQMELYKLMVLTRDTQIKVAHDVASLTSDFNMQSIDTEQLRKDCSMEELRSEIIQLKLELVRACAVVAEARTQAETKDLPQWTQADPLTTKRMASVKKLAYYVQTQLDQAHKVLDYKWNELASRDLQYNKPGHRMIRPILDDVYQPLVKQQEILSRQQAVLRTLKNTLKECEVSPIFKSASILRSTPFRNKDPLSKLTKNILNMSIEQQSKNKEQVFTAQKMDALREVLSNHKTIKIKPVSVELRQHLAAMKLSYEKSMKEKAQAPVVKAEPVEIPTQVVPAPSLLKPVPKPDLVSQPITVAAAPASFTPVTNLKSNLPGVQSVARTLFTNEPKMAPENVSPKPQPQPATQAKLTNTTFFTPTTLAPPIDTSSVLKHLLRTDSKPEVKDSNIFMGQKICSPSAFNFSSSPSNAASVPPSIFTAKPIEGISSMFDKLKQDNFGSITQFASEAKTQPQAPTTLKPQTKSVKSKSNETGETVAAVEQIKKTDPKPKEERPITNLFAMKSSTALANAPQNIPDVLKSNVSISLPKDTKSIAKIEKVPEQSKENVPEKPVENTVKSATDDTKALGIQTANKPGLASGIQTVEATIKIPTPSTLKEALKQTEPKPDIKTPPKSPEVSDSTSTSASIFATAESSAGKTQSIFGASSTTTPTFGTSPKQLVTASEAKELTSSSSGTSIFASAVEPQTPTVAELKPETAPSKEESNVSNNSQSVVEPSKSFSLTPVQPSSPTSETDPKSLFASQTASVFGSPTSTQGSSSIFSSSTTSKSVFGTPTSTTQSVFGSSSPTAQSVFSAASSQAFGSPTTQNVFGTSTTSAPSLFSSATSTQSVFGVPATTQSVFSAESTPSSVFGSVSSTASVFGTPTVTTTAGFGSTNNTSTASVFGTSKSSSFAATTTTQSIFGTGTATTQSVFTTPTTQTSVFGSPTSQPSAFGASQSVFGSSAPSTQSVFGSPQTTQSSIFGSSQPSQSSVFGTPSSTTAQSGSLFGGNESNLFAAASISTTNAQSPTSGGNIFGGGSTSGSVFGGGSSNIFGGKSTFGQSNNSAASIFGGANATFGQKPASDFWSGGNAATGESGFGSTGFGQQATNQSSSIFGGGSGGSFSTPSPAGQAFGSPQQPPAFGADNKQSVFGSPQQPASAFGGSPVFGAKPAFGQPSGFGSSPTGGFGAFGGFNKSPSGFGAPASFGGGATFGGSGFGGTSPNKVFGGQSPSFGSPTQANTTFENLATQETLTFGNLAQQSAPQQASGFNTSPSFTGWRG